MLNSADNEPVASKFAADAAVASLRATKAMAEQNEREFRLARAILRYRTSCTVAFTVVPLFVFFWPMLSDTGVAICRQLGKHRSHYEKCHGRPLWQRCESGIAFDCQMSWSREPCRPGIVLRLGFANLFIGSTVEVSRVVDCHQN